MHHVTLRWLAFASAALTPLIALASWLAEISTGAALIATVASALLAHLLLRQHYNNTSLTQSFVQRLIDVIPQPVYIKDSSGRYVMINEAFAEQRGESPQQILGKTARELAPDAKISDLVAQEDLEVLAGANVFKEDYTVHGVSREPVCRIVTKDSCYNNFGEKVIVGANFDITAMRMAEKNLKAALDQQTEVAARTRNFIQTLVDEIPYPIYVRDAQLRYQIVNRAMLQRYNLPREAVIGKTIKDLHPSAERSRVSMEEDRAVITGKHIHKEEHGLHPLLGTPYNQLVIKGACPDIDGQPVIVGINIDITDLRSSQQLLTDALEREREQHASTIEYIQRLLDLLPWPVYVKDARSRFIMVNEAMARDRQTPRDALLNTTGLSDLSSSDSIHALFDEDSAVLAGQRILREERLAHPSTGLETFRILAKGRCLDARGEPVIVGTTVDLTGLRQAERELHATIERETRLRERTEAFLQRLIDIIPDPFYVKRNGHYVLINEAFANYQGRTREELLNPEEPFPHLSEESRLRSLEEDKEVLAGHEIKREEHTVRRVTGEEVYRIVTKRPSVFIDGEPVVVGMDRHITEWRQAELEARNALARETALRQHTLEFIQRLIDLIPDPVYVKKNAGQYVLVNEAMLSYHQLSRESVLAHGLRLSDTDIRQLSMDEDAEVLAGGEIIKEEHTVRRATGEEVYRVVTKRRSTYFDGDPVVVGIDHHITRWRVAERELQRLAREDALTGLANRRHFRQEAERFVMLCQRHADPLTLIMFDLDHFKVVNDRFGHNFGDEVLKETVARCSVCLRNTDLFARWGGEEFIILLPHTGLDEASGVAERLRESLASCEIRHGETSTLVTLSGGVVQWQTGQSLDQMISCADAALYAAKRNGRNRFERYARPQA